MALKRFLGSILSATPPTVGTSGFEDSSASGRWSPSQILSYIADAVWPTQGNVPTYVDDVYSTYVYDGTGSTRSITNNLDLSGEGGLTWIKLRDGGSGPLGSHLYDTERGATKKIRSDNTDAEATVSNGLTSFNSDGFSLGNDVGVNGSATGDSYVAFSFLKKAGFLDIVTYTGNSTSGRAIAHNLGSTPGFVIVKCTSDAEVWRCFHRTFSAGEDLQFNGTFAKGSNGNFPTVPDANNFYVAAGNQVNGTGKTYVAYLFAHDDQRFGENKDQAIISCGSFNLPSYTDTSVSVGFEPQWVLVKNVSTTDDWRLIDVVRGAPLKGLSSAVYRSNLSNNEVANNGNQMQPQPDGFIWTGSSGWGYTGDHIYIAIRKSMKPPTAGTSVYNALTYTGDAGYGTKRTTGVFTDLLISKSRSNTTNWAMYDRLRGANGIGSGSKILKPNTTNADTTQTGTAVGVYDFDYMDGYLAWADQSDAAINFNSYTYCNWAFKQAAGFLDIVSYTGNATVRTITHNLGAVPKMMIVKQLTDAGYYWYVYHQGFSNYGGSSPALYLRTDSNTNAAATSAWNSTDPTASVFSLGTDSNVNGNNKIHIAYLFGDVAGVSKCGYYQGTASDLDVDCGFTSGARFILIKRIDASGDWFLFDSERGIVSGNDPHLHLNETAAEASGDDIDPLSSGFTVVGTSTWLNINTAKYIFLAVA